MRFLVDMPLSPLVAEWLNDRGHKAVRAVEIGLKASSDEVLLQKAAKEKQVIVTCDLDFPRILAMTGEKGPPIIFFRGGNYGNAEVLELLEHTLRSIPEQDLSGLLVIVEHKRLRKIKLPLKLGVT